MTRSTRVLLAMKTVVQIALYALLSALELSRLCCLNRSDVVQECLQQGSCCTCARPGMFLSYKKYIIIKNKKSAAA